MNKIRSLLFAAVLPVTAFSQLSDPPRPGINPFRDDQNARAVYNKPHDFNVEGSPFLVDEYIPMEITLMDGGVFSDVRVKFNMEDNEVVFQSDGGQEMVTSSPVKRLRYKRTSEDGGVTEQVTLESFNSALNVKGAPIYEVLTDGNARLLKQILVTYTDTRKYPEGTMARVFKKKASLWASINNNAPVKVEKNKKDVVALFGDKQAQVSSYIDKEKLKCKTETDLISIFNYYSSLN